MSSAVLPSVLAVPESEGPTAADVELVLVASVAWVLIFAAITVMVWARQRRLEREAFYRTELRRHLVEKGELSLDQLRQLEADEQARQFARRREGVKLTGLVLAALGVGLLAALWSHADAPAIGWVPLCTGGAVLGYAMMLRPPRES